MSLVAPELDYEVRSFAAGFLDTPELDSLPRGGTGEAKNCLLASPQSNVEVSQYGQSSVRAVVSKRPGAMLINVAPLAAGVRIDSLYEFLREGVTAGDLLVTAGGNLYAWDGATTFTLIASGLFTAGVPTRWTTFRNLAIGYDGTNAWAYDGTNAPFVPGLATPTAEGGLADGGAGGALPAATWEAVQTWYDQVHDHEGSITQPSTQLVLAANHLRQHTIPGGAVPTAATHYRTYVRRVDINEQYYKRVGETAVATGSFTESISDAARNLFDLAPLPDQNDPPPVFAVAAPYAGSLFGAKQDDSFVSVSRVNDPQSQNPSDQIGVGRGDGEGIRSILPLGTDILVQKPTKTYRMQGDRMPFVPQEVSPELGNVGQDSAGEVNGMFYAWDDIKGPYRMTLTSFDTLADRRVQNFVSSVNRASNPEVRFVHLKDLSMVGWSLATGPSPRMRSLLFYHYGIEAWLPPITGIEYSAMTTFKTSTGEVFLYVGDYRGRIFQYFTGNVEGVISGSLIARVSAATASTVTCDVERTPNAGGGFSTTATGVAFVTAGSGLAGLPVAVVDASGLFQWRRVQSNTGSQISLDTVNDSAWDTVPVAGYTCIVGGIDWYWTTGVIDYANPRLKKKGAYFYVEIRPSTTSFALTIKGRFNKSMAAGTVKTFAGAVAGAVWGVGEWGVSLFGGGSSTGKKTRVSRSFYTAQFQVSNGLPNEPVDLTFIGVTADWLHRKGAPSGA